MVIEPDLYINGAIGGLKLFVYKVFPSLFPFFFITRILTMLGVGEYLSRCLSKPLKYVYNVPPISGYIFVLSILSGYPVGAKLVSDYLKNGLIDKEDATAIISFTSTSGPMFILGTVGVGMLDNYKAGLIILVSHLISAMVNGVLYRKSKFNVYERTLLQEEATNSLFNDALRSSVDSILLVGANIIILNVFLIALKRIGAIDLVAELFVLIGGDKMISTGIAFGLVEITQGISILSQYTQNIKDIIVISSVIISFGGVSVMMQSMSFLSKVEIKTSYYLITKISQAIIAYVITSFLVMFY